MGSWPNDFWLKKCCGLMNEVFRYGESGGFILGVSITISIRAVIAWKGVQTLVTGNTALSAKLLDRHFRVRWEEENVPVAVPHTARHSGLRIPTVLLVLVTLKNRKNGVFQCCCRMSKETAKLVEQEQSGRAGKAIVAGSRERKELHM